MSTLEAELSQMHRRKLSALALIVLLASRHPDVLPRPADKRSDRVLDVLRKLFDLLCKEGGGRA